MGKCQVQRSKNGPVQNHLDENESQERSRRRRRRGGRTYGD